MTYREPDPENEKQLAANEEIERAARSGAEARAAHEAGIEKRLLRERPPGAATALVTAGSGMVAYMAVILAGATLPIGIAAGAGAFGIGLIGATTVDRIRLRRANAWLARLPFPVVGYIELLRTRRIVTSISAKLTLDSVEEDDRTRVIDMLGKLDTVDPVVTIEGNTMTIEILVAGSVKKLARTLIEQVATPLDEARRIRLLELAASTADAATPYSPYR